MMNPDPPPNSYESNLSRLKDVVERLERDSLGLEESLTLFEEGMSLAQACDAQLGAVEERVKVLVEGSTELTPRADIPLEPVTSVGYGDE